MLCKLWVIYLSVNFCLISEYNDKDVVKLKPGIHYKSTLGRLLVSYKHVTQIRVDLGAVIFTMLLISLGVEKT